MVATTDPRKPVRVIGDYPSQPQLPEKPWWVEASPKRNLERETKDNREPVQTQRSKSRWAE